MVHGDATSADRVIILESDDDHRLIGQGKHFLLLAFSVAAQSPSIRLILLSLSRHPTADPNHCYQRINDQTFAMSLLSTFTPTPFSQDVTIVANNAIQAKVKAVLYYTLSAALIGQGIVGSSTRLVYAYREPHISRASDSSFCSARQLVQALEAMAERCPETPYGDTDLDRWIAELLQPNRVTTDWRRDSLSLLNHAEKQLEALDVLMQELRQKATPEQIEAWYEMPGVEREASWRPTLEMGIAMGRRTCSASI